MTEKNLSRKELKELKKISASFEEVSRMIQEREYECMICERSIDSARAEYWSLMLEIDCTILTEEKRKEIDSKSEAMREKIEASEGKLQKISESVTWGREQLEKVRQKYDLLQKQVS